MNRRQFTYILEEQLDTCSAMLAEKRGEYASDEDVLRAFKMSAALRDVTIRAALSGMMSKHTVSIYDMCESPKTFSDEVWDEKITDHINYLILLKAVIYEEKLSILLEKLAADGPVNINDGVDGSNA